MTSQWQYCLFQLVSLFSHFSITPFHIASDLCFAPRGRPRYVADKLSILQPKVFANSSMFWNSWPEEVFFSPSQCEALTLCQTLVKSASSSYHLHKMLSCSDSFDVLWILFFFNPLDALKPFIHPSCTAVLSVLLKPSITNMKKKVERGSPCLIPLSVTKKAFWYLIDENREFEWADSMSYPV